MRAFLALSAVVLLLGAVAGEADDLLDVRVGILANYPPFSQPADSPGPDNHGGLEGFEVDLMDALCAGARLNCTAVPMRSFDERIVALTSTTVDVLLAGLSYSEERAQRVRFVRPFYYSAGVELYSDSKEGQALAEALKGGGGFPAGTKLCIQEGFYAQPYIERDLPQVELVVIPSNSFRKAAEAVAEGSCAAFVGESAAPESAVGMPRLDTGKAPAYATPWGAAISLADAGSELEDRLAHGLTQLMSEGRNSTILALEAETLVPAGVEPNANLAAVVDAVSTFATAGDATWQ